MLRLALRVGREDAEVVLARLLELAPSGLEERDVDPGAVEYALYGEDHELPTPEALRTVAGAALIDVVSTEVRDDWAERWRDFHRPLVLGRRLSVRPPWEPRPDTELDIVIDPGRAFGTGAHATTRLCLELLLELSTRRDGTAPAGAVPEGEAQGPTVIDLGCGSGVLAIAAVKLGFGTVLALDHDPVCVEVTRENAAVNGARLIGIERFDLTEDRLPYAPLVLANLLAPLLRAWCERMRAAADRERPDTVIASGLLASEADEVSGYFAALGYAERRRVRRDQWAALLLGRASHR